MGTVAFSVTRRAVGGQVFVTTGTANVTESEDTTSTTSVMVTGSAAVTEEADTVNATQGAWLTTKAQILAAFAANSLDIRIGWGTYSFNAGEGLHLEVPNQKVTGQPDGLVKLVATVNRGQYGARGVIEIDPTAHFAEISGVTLAQTLDQSILVGNPEYNTQPPTGIWSEANDWYLHDLVIDHCSFGLTLWKGTGGGVRRLHRVVITNTGYNGVQFGHSGYGIYIQTPDPMAGESVEVEDLVIQEITRYGIHDYGTFTMDAPRVINGICVCNAGSAVPTGGVVTDPSPTYLAKAADLEIHHGHFYQNKTHTQFHYCLNRVGYGDIDAIRFLASDTWAAERPTQPHPASRWQAQRAESAWPGGFVKGDKTEWNVAGQQALFSGIKQLGPTWSVCYGAVPGTHIQVLGTIAYPAADGMPALTIVMEVQQ